MLRHRVAFALALCAALAAFATSAAAAPRVELAPYAEGEVLLRFKPTATAADRARILAEVGASEVRRVGLGSAERLRISTLSVPDALARLAGDPALDYVEPNYLVRTQEAPNDALFPLQWALNNFGQSGGTPGADIRATAAWDVFTGAQDVVVAVIDTGIDLQHPDLRANLFVNGDEAPNNGVDDDGNGFIDDVMGWNCLFGNNDADDDNGHGTHVAGIVGAVGDNATGVAGVTWRVRLVPLKFLDSSGLGASDSAAGCIDYAIRVGAKVINASWGGGGPSQTLFDAIARANAAGVLFVAAAGNGNPGADNDLTPFYPASYDLPNLISVAATDHNDRLWSASNYGAQSVDVAAPGVGIYSTIPGSNYAFLSGTSMAAPHVSGTLALIRGRFPGASAATARTLLLDRADRVPALAGRVATGARINAFLSIAEADTTPPARTIDLTAVDPNSARIDLTWTAPGDDGTVGTAASYDVRVSINPIDGQNFAAASPLPDVPDPSPAGSAEHMRVSGLEPDTKYYFALRAADEFGNLSPVSNVALGTTTGPPAVAIEPLAVAAALFTGGRAERTVRIDNSGAGEYLFDVSTLRVAGAAALVAPVETAGPERGVVELAPVLPASLVPYAPPAAPATEPPRAAAAADAASGIPALIVHSGTTPGEITERLLALPGFSRIDVFDARLATPTLEDLRAYAVVIVMVNIPFADRTALGNALADYVDAGGGVVLTLASFVTGWQIEGRFLSGGYYPFNLGAGPSGAASLGDYDASHPIMAGVQEAAGDLLGSVTLADGALPVASWDDGRPLVATKGSSVVAVNVYVSAGGFWTGDVPLLLRNAALWSTSAVGWLRALPATGVVPPGSSLDVNVVFDAAALAGGAFDAQLVFHGNDPVAPRIPVVAHLDVTSAPDIDVDGGPVVFGDTFVGDTTEAVVSVANFGAETLHVTDLVLDDGEFTLGTLPFGLAPGQRREILLGFAPRSPGERRGTLRLLSNDPDEPERTIELVGVGLLPPAIALDPGTFDEQLLAGQSTVRPLTITNTGGSPLEFSVGVQRPDQVEAANSSAGAEDAPFLFEENFEDGDFAGWGASLSQNLKDVTDQTAANGSRFSQHQAGRQRGHFTGIYRDLGGDRRPRYVGFWVRPGSTVGNSAYFVLRDSRGCPTIGGCEVIWFFAQDGGYFYVNADVGGNELVRYEAHTWYHVEFKNIDFTTQRFDYHVDGVLIQAGVPFRRQAFVEAIRRIDLYLFDPDTEGWWDEITVADVEPPEPVSVGPTSGRLPAGESMSLAVTFDAHGVAAGEHPWNLIVDSTAPATPRIVVPALLRVLSAPDIELPDPLPGFGQVFVGNSSERVLVVANAGTEALAVSAIASDTADFDAVEAGFVVAPGARHELVLRFRPSAVGLREARIRLSSNDPDEPEIEVVARGQGLAPPVIAVEPRSVSAQLFTGGQAGRDVFVENHGGSDLVIEVLVERTVQGASARADAPVLAPSRAVELLPVGAEAHPDHPAGPPESGPPPAGASAPFHFADDFEDGDLVGWRDAGGSGVKEVTDQTAANGTRYSYHEYDAPGGHFTGVFQILGGVQPRYVSVWVRPGTPNVPTTYFALRNFAGLDGVFFFAHPSGRFYCNEDVGGDLSVPYTVGSWYHVEFKDIDFAAKTFDYYVDNALIASDVAFRYPETMDSFHRLDLYSYFPGSAAWWDEIVISTETPIEPISVTPLSAVVPPGGRTALRVNFDATGLGGGSYPAKIVVGSNDPLAGETEVQALLEVTSAADLDVSAGELDFGTPYVGASVTRGLVLRNRGTAGLEITALVLDTPEFEIDAVAPFALAPGEAREVTVTFRPSVPGPVSASLVVRSDDPDEPEFVVRLEAAPLPAPDAAVTPGALSVELFTGQRAERTVTLDNSGASPLRWEIAFAGGATPAWLRVDPPSGLVAPFGSTPLDVSLDATGLGGGEYATSILVRSDDPDEPEIAIDVRLLVTSAPDVAVTPPALDFGVLFLGATVELRVTVSNVGAAPLAVTARTEGAGFSTGGAGLRLDPGAAAYVEVTFFAGTSGIVEGALVLTTDDPDESEVRVALRADARPPPEIVVAPAEFDERLHSGETVVRALEIRNLAGSELEFEVAVEPRAAGAAAAIVSDAASTAARRGLAALGDEEQPGAEGPPPGPTETAGRIAVAPPAGVALASSPGLFVDDFEDGDFKDWEIGSGSGIKEITSLTAADGSRYSYREYNSSEGHLDGIWHPLGGLRPRYIGFWVRLGSTEANAGYFVLRNGAGYEAIFFFAAANGRFYVNGDVGGDTTLPYQAERWYFVEFKDIDYVTHRFDYYVNRKRIRRGVGLRNPSAVNEVSRLDLYNFDRGGQAYWDEIAIRTDAPFTPVVARPTEGRVAPGESTSVAVTFDAIGLNAGDYAADVVVRSNDPGDPVVVVPAQLHVTGTPDIGVSRRTLEFGTVRIGVAESRSVTVTNFGTDTLEVGEVRLAGGPFSANASSLSLAPEQSRGITVTFAPLSEGAYAGTLTLLSNDPDRPALEIALVGEGITPAKAELSPPELTEVRYPGELSTRALALANAGGETLEYSVEVVAAGGAPIPAEATLFFDDVERDDRGWVTEVYGLDDLWHRSQRASLSPATSWWCGSEETGHYGTPYAISAALISPPIDLRGLSGPLWLTFNERYLTEPLWDECLVDVSTDGGESWVPLRGKYGLAPSGDSKGWTTTRLELSAFADRLVRIRFYFETTDPTNNALPGWFVDDVRVSAVVDPWLSVDPAAGSLGQGSSTELQVAFDAVRLRPPGTYAATIGVATNDPLHARIEVPTTMIVAVPPRLALPGETVRIETAVDPTGRRGSTHRIGLDRTPAGPAEATFVLVGDYGASGKTATASAEGFVLGVAGGGGAPCASTERTFALAALDLDAAGADGVLDFEVRNSAAVGSACPVNRHTLRLSYPAAVEQVALGQTPVGLGTTATLVVANEGEGPLRVDSIVADAPGVSVEPATLTLGPAERATLELRWTPATAGPFAATLALASNDPARPVATVRLAGEALVAPAQIALAPDALVAALPPGGAEPKLLTVHLANLGQGPLVWNTEPPPAWLSVVPDAGTLAPGAAVELQVELRAEALDTGEYAHTLVLHSNDPLHPRLELPVTLHVGRMELARFELRLTPKYASGPGTVEAVLQLPAGYPPDEVATETVTIHGVPALPAPVSLHDVNRDGTQELVLQFDAAAFAATLPAGDVVSVRIDGEVRDRSWFTGSIWLRGVAEIRP